MFRPVCPSKEMKRLASKISLCVGVVGVPLPACCSAYLRFPPFEGARGLPPKTSDGRSCARRSTITFVAGFPHPPIYVILHLQTTLFHGREEDVFVFQPLMVNPFCVIFFSRTYTTWPSSKPTESGVSRKNLAVFVFTTPPSVSIIGTVLLLISLDARLV